MQRKLSLAIILTRLSNLSFALVSILILSNPQAVAEDPVVLFSRDDAVMNAAIRKGPFITAYVLVQAC